MSKIKIVIVAVAVALVGLAAFGATALADEPTPTPQGLTGRIADLVERMRNALASRLGIAPEELDDAAEAAREDVVSQLLEEGLITAEQAERILGNGASGFAGLMRFGRGGRGHRLPRGWPMAGGHMLETIAEQLDMTVDELRAELRAGKSVAQLAEEKGVALETIVEAIVADMSEVLAQAVESGRLTQEQADCILDQLREQLPTLLSWTSCVPGGYPMPWGYPMPRGEFWGRPSTTPPEVRGSGT